MLLLLFVLFVLFTCVYAYFKYRFSYWKIRGVPYPQPTILFGNVLKSMTLQYGLGHILKDIYNSYPEYNYLGFFISFKPCILIRDPELVKDILIKDFNKFHDNYVRTDESVDPILGLNAFLRRGDTWKHTRIQASAQLTSAKVKLMTPLCEQVCRDMINYLKENIKEMNNGMDAKNVALKFTINNVISSAYGLDGTCFADLDSEFIKFSDMISTPGSFTFIKHTLAIHFPNLGNFLGLSFIGAKVPTFFHEIITSTIKYRDDNHVVRDDYLDAIRNIKDKDYTMNNIVANAFTLYLDGTETSAIVLSNTLYELAINPEVQTKAKNIIEQVFQKYGGKLTSDGLQEMDYLHYIILESLRKHPVILIMARLCTEDYELPPSKNGQKSVLIEKGTPIFIPVLGIHNDPKYYPDPEQFDPDRFAEKQSNSRPKCSFLGFGEGPRICLGRTFALFQLKAALAFILMEFEVRLHESCPTPLQPETLQMMLNTPKTPIILKFLERNK